MRKNFPLRLSGNTIPESEHEKEPFWTGGDRFAAPGQEGLFDHMFDHRQGRNIRKQRVVSRIGPVDKVAYKPFLW